MAAKPTREELELKIEASEKEAKKLAQTEAELVRHRWMKRGCSTGRSLLRDGSPQT